MIKITNLDVYFNRNTPDENHALKNINLKVNRGDFITIIGSNGAGKSTLLNAISGTIPVTNGHIYLDEEGLEITNEKEYKRAKYISRIFQNPLLGTAGKMSLEDNMTISMKKGFKTLKTSLNENLRLEFRENLRDLNMGLENRLRDNVSQFSGGQRQALTLLMAVMSRPSLLLLDEHTAALDPPNANLVMHLTKHFAEVYGLTVIMITHNMQHALDYGNRLLMMDGGEIILDIGKEEKSKLTLKDIQAKFKAIKKTELNNDNMILQ